MPNKSNPKPPKTKIIPSNAVPINFLLELYLQHSLYSEMIIADGRAVYKRNYARKRADLKLIDKRGNLRYYRKH
jgi:hypothetical protein